MRKCVKDLYLYHSDDSMGWYYLQRREEHSGHIESFCPKTFESVTGVVLKPGETRKVKRISIVFAKKRGKRNV